LYLAISTRNPHDLSMPALASSEASHLTLAANLMHDPISSPAGGLRRRLTLPLLVLYGVGISIGAGIYVLVGAVAEHAGGFAPWAFVASAVVMALTVASYSELSARFPVSAGEAAYVRAAFDSRLLSTLTGLLTVAIGVVSTAAVTLGSAGYIGQFTTVEPGIIVAAIIISLALVASWGILESVMVAAVLTLIEVGGLIVILVAASGADLPLAEALKLPPVFEPGILSGLAAASLLAFFAFIGFEDLANVAEEAVDPERTLPLAMMLTLAIVTLLYVAIAAVAVSAVPIAELAGSSAPLSLVFRKLTGISPAAISLIAIVATLNTILAQMTMASRVLYGMARQGDLPPVLGRVYSRTSTPLIATALVAACSMTLALAAPIGPLAKATSVATLAVFAMVNLALIRLRQKERGGPEHLRRIPGWVSWAGLIACLGMIAGALFS
jgi:basic amino acid/polyamine antiporter, APA family